MIICTVKSSSGEIMGTFHPKGKKNLLDEAADEGIEMPFSCHAGACMSCATRVIQGMELLDLQKDGTKYVDTDADVALTCIAGVKESFVMDDEEHILEVEVLM
ncbi:2Fe-2S iron-sulfur cluster binding domain-containing protein [Candidatus Peregrinibacteria bacterium]|nr:2Fe-2S iron-sulfur cluster binding domain-containing protein [Candidatus Peregrinibacteria bacterium]